MSSTQQPGIWDYPRPKGRPLTPAELMPADILLSRGNSHISDLIVEADRGSYSHGALWSGSGIIESTLKGGVAEQAASGNRDVYRFVAAAGDGLTSLGDAEREAIVAAGRKHVGNAYDTAEIHLLAVVFNKWWPTARPRRSLASSLLETLGGGKADQLRSWLQGVYRRSAPRICTELVALAYFESGHGLRVLPTAKRPPLPVRASEEAAPEPELALEAAQLNVSVYEALWANDDAAKTVASALAVPVADAKGILYGDVAYDSDSGAPVGVVTPGDLQFSPSLRFVGNFDTPEH
jgi:hypothetical protein